MGKGVWVENRAAGAGSVHLSSTVLQLKRCVVV